MSDAPAPEGAPAPDAAPARSPATLFWAAVLAFVIADGGARYIDALPRWIPENGGGVAFAYVLLAAFALAVAYVALVVLSWIRTRRPPGPLRALGALVLLAVIAIHVVSLIVVGRR